jgi:hypothetical protein
MLAIRCSLVTSLFAVLALCMPVATRGAGVGRSIFEETPVPSSQAAPAAAPGAAASRAPVPEAAAQATAERLIREVLRAEYEDRAPQGKRKLAAALLAQLANAGDTTERFVLLREARDAAVQGGEIPVLVDALDHLTTGYAVDPVSIKLQAYSAALPAAEQARSTAALAQAAVGAADEASVRGDQASAEKLIAVAEKAAASTSDASLSHSIKTKVALFREVTAARERSAAAEARLKSNPNDAAAKTVLGTEMCLRRGEWDVGLKLLAGCDDPQLRELALNDLRRPADPVKRFELAESWWSLQSKLQDPQSQRVRERALIWYAAAVPELTGLKRALAERRVAEASGSGTARRTEVLPPVDPRDPTAPAKSIVYVCDGSGSMMGLPFDLLKQELRKAVSVLVPHQSFNIVFFQKGKASALAERMLTASPRNVGLANDWLGQLQVASNSDPLPSLTFAFGQRPQLIYLLTDGAFDNNDVVVAEIRRLNVGKHTRVNTIALFSPDHPEGDRMVCEDVLRTIAKENGGQFKVVLTTELKQLPR